MDHKRFAGKTHLLDIFSPAETNLHDGVAATIAGSFQPVMANRTLSFSLDLSRADAGYGDTSLRAGTDVSVLAAPVAHAQFGNSVVSYSLFDVSHSTSQVQTITNDPYSDPLPASWPRSLRISHSRGRAVAQPPPGKRVALALLLGTKQLLEYTGWSIRHRCCRHHPMPASLTWISILAARSCSTVSRLWRSIGVRWLVLLRIGWM